jgi:threonine/homoserine efflux transporter RhtA
MKVEPTLRTMGFAFFALPLVGSFALNLLHVAGIEVLEGTNEEKWTLVNFGVLSWLISGAIWIAYALHRLYRPEL